MTMHLVRGMSTINSKKRRVNRKPGQAAALAKHDEWLRKNGVHPDQLKKKESVVATVYRTISLRVKQSQRRIASQPSKASEQQSPIVEITSSDLPRYTSLTRSQLVEAMTQNLILK